MTEDGKSCNPSSDDGCIQHIVVYHCVNQAPLDILREHNRVYFEELLFTHTSHWWTWTNSCHGRIEIWVPVNKVSLILSKAYGWDGFLLPGDLKHYTVVLQGPIVLTKMNDNQYTYAKDMMMFSLPLNSDEDFIYNADTQDFQQTDPDMYNAQSCNVSGVYKHHCGVELLSFRVSHVLIDEDDVKNNAGEKASGEAAQATTAAVVSAAGASSAAADAAPDQPLQSMVDRVLKAFVRCKKKFY